MIGGIEGKKERGRGKEAPICGGVVGGKTRNSYDGTLQSSSIDDACLIPPVGHSNTLLKDIVNKDGGGE